MKRIFQNILLLFAGVLVFSSCENLNEPTVFNADEYAFVSFENASYKTYENETSELVIGLQMAAEKGAAATVEFEIIEGTAKIGETFNLVNETSVLTFAEGVGMQFINISMIDNEIREGNKSFKIAIKSNSNGYIQGIDGKDTITVTINDDEHPLELLIGSYHIAGNDVLWGEVIDETVSVDPVEGDLTALEINLYNSLGAENTVIATVDMDTKTISFSGGQNFGNWGYGDVLLKKGDPTNPVTVGSYVCAAPLDESIKGIFDAEGNFTLENWGGYFPDAPNQGLWWQFYETATWTKQ